MKKFLIKITAYGYITEFTEKPVSVIAPVSLASLITLNPPFDLIGPLNVEFAILNLLGYIDLTT